MGRSRVGGWGVVVDHEGIKRGLEGSVRRSVFVFTCDGCTKTGTSVNGNPLVDVHDRVIALGYMMTTGLGQQQQRQ